MGPRRRPLEQDESNGGRRSVSVTALRTFEGAIDAAAFRTFGPEVFAIGRRVGLGPNKGKETLQALIDVDSEVWRLPPGRNLIEC